MINLHPELVLKNAALWDAQTIAWAQAQVDQRAAWDNEDQIGRLQRQVKRLAGEVETLQERT